MSEDSFDCNLLDLIDEELPTMPILVGHTMVYGSGSNFNCAEDHPYRTQHEYMNSVFDNKHPHLRIDYETKGTYQMMALPIIKDKYSAHLCEYSHDIVYMMLEGSDVGEIDRFIDSINSDAEFRRSRPPFRFKYVNICCVSISRYPSSKHLYC